MAGVVIGGQHTGKRAAAQRFGAHAGDNAHMLVFARIRFLLLIVVVCCGLVLYGQQVRSGPWVMETSGTTAGLRGIHAVGGGVAWASGTNGTVLRTEDGGYMWQRCAVPPRAEKLDVRGIWAWDADTAIIMSSGTGDQSRIYQTTDGCSHWKLMFTNPDANGFWDAMVFRDHKHGYLVGDAVRGRIALFTTNDGGKTWTRSAAPGLKRAMVQPAFLPRAILRC
jgi:photosystem II stability/assembly factor-like uncharacterized protein